MRNRLGRRPAHPCSEQGVAGRGRFFKADGSGRRTDSFGPPKGRIRTQDGQKIFKADGNERRTDSFGPPQGRIRTSDTKKNLKADGALSSASRTNSDVGRGKFLKGGRRTKADQVRPTSPDLNPDESKPIQNIKIRFCKKTD